MYTEWLDSLKNVELFQNIEKDELNSMLMCFNPKIETYQKKEYIAMEGDPFTGVGVVIEGEVTITKDNAAGERVIMTKLNANSIFGEIFAFSNSKIWGVTVIAATDCKVLFITPERIIGHCRNMCIGHHILIQNMLKIVSQKALGLDKKIRYLAMKSIRTKISSFLLEQHKLSGSNRFMISYNREELADYLNVSRPSLSREMIKMRDEGIIDFYKATFQIMDIETIKMNI
ncbi:MAG: Crp/Fnr family transcriptional regulator [Peptostreptococcaceae bacterium]|nr:Crp/Fnr family transcriptional regulator [Peptostreptococcaceae bacterium]